MKDAPATYFRLFHLVGLSLSPSPGVSQLIVTMGFLSICTALYGYSPQSDGELAIDEGELLYILEKSEEDDWWKAKKKASSEEEEEPVGLIPNNYVEEVSPTNVQKNCRYFISAACTYEIWLNRSAIGPTHPRRKSFI